MVINSISQLGPNVFLKRPLLSIPVACLRCLDRWLIWFHSNFVNFYPGLLLEAAPGTHASWHPDWFVLWQSCTGVQRINGEENFLLTFIREGCKKKSWKSVVFCQTGGGGEEGSPRVNKKPNLKFANVFCSVNMHNHSRTPKTCFTLGLECLCHIFSP